MKFEGESEFVDFFNIARVWIATTGCSRGNVDE